MVERRRKVEAGNRKEEQRERQKRGTRVKRKATARRWVKEAQTKKRDIRTSG